MAGEINDLLKDQKFEKINFYLRANGFRCLKDLHSFQPEDLYFIPGVSVKLAQDAERMIKAYLRNDDYQEDEKIQDQALLSILSKHIHEFANHHLAIPKPHEEKLQDSHIKEFADCNDHNLRIPVYVAFADLRKGDWFGNRCKAKGKAFMDQLSREDFSELTNLRGIEIATSSQLFERYEEYVASPASFCERSLDTEVDSYAHHYFSPGTIRWLRSAGLRTIRFMQNFDFNHMFDSGRMPLASYIEVKEFLRQMLLWKQVPEEPGNVKDADVTAIDSIPPENLNIQLRILAQTNLLSRETLKTYEEQGVITFGDFGECMRDKAASRICQYILSLIELPLVKRYISEFEALNASQRKVLLSRASGLTLLQIGNEIGISKEKARQLEVRAMAKLENWSILVGGVLLGRTRRFLSYDELSAAFDDPVHVRICSRIFQEYSSIDYLEFSDKYDFLPQGDPVHNQFGIMAENFVGDGIDLYEILDLVEEEIDSRGLSELDSEDFMNFLLYSGYQFFGDFVVVPAKASLLIYYDAISRFFPLDIKLDSKGNNPDMARLREIVKSRYPGFQQPENNRALTSMITRNPRMILSGLGLFRPFEKVIFSRVLFDEVRQYIENSTQSTFFDYELFELFKGRFFAETNIHNQHFFHGMMKYLFPESFIYRKGKIIKIGGEQLSADDRISRLVKEKGRPVTKEEIREAIPGIAEYLINFAVERVTGLIPWDNNRINHLDNVMLDDQGLRRIKECLLELTENCGYTTANLFFHRVQEFYPAMLNGNQLNNRDNLFYVASHYFGEEYRFSSPHIAKSNFPVENLTLANVAKYFFDGKESFSYSQLVRFAREMGWSSGSCYSIISELESDYLKISKDVYLKKSALDLTCEDRALVKAVLSEITGHSGYYAIFSYFNFQRFPKINLDWNSHFLESVIKNFDVGHRMLESPIRTRTTQRGVIVPCGSKFETLNDLVRDYLGKSGITSISKQDLQELLEKAGIIEGALFINLDSPSHWSIKGERLYLK